jgi:hypothetical protein
MTWNRPPLERRYLFGVVVPSPTSLMFIPERDGPVSTLRPANVPWLSMVTSERQPDPVHCRKANEFTAFE